MRIKRIDEMNDVSDNIIKKYSLVLNRETNRYDCNKSVVVERDLVYRGKLIIPFGEIYGSFICNGEWRSYMPFELVTLENAPQYVQWDFNCGCNGLTSLEGAPEYVGGDFCCYSNKLTSLKGSPRKINKDFSCSSNRLTTLEGAPEYVGGDFDCSNNILKDTIGKPKTIKGKFDCSGNKPLEIGKIEDDANFLFDDSTSKDEKLKMIDDLKPYFNVHCVASEALLLEIFKKLSEKNELEKIRRRAYNGDDGKDVYVIYFELPNAESGDYETLTLNKDNRGDYVTFDIYDYPLGARTGTSYQSIIKEWRLETVDYVLKQIYRTFVKRYYKDEG